MFKIRNRLNFRVLCLVFMFSMIFGISASLPTYASEPVEDFQFGFGSVQADEGSETTIVINLNKSDPSTPTLDEDFKVVTEEPLDATTRGLAPPLSSIMIGKGYWLANGNFGVIVEIMGYGKNWRSTFNHQPATVVYKEAVSNSINNEVIGYYYIFDCGPVTIPGIYNFKAMFRGFVHPYNTMSSSIDFTFKYE